MQSFNMNYANAYQNQRSFGGNVVGAWRSYSLNATVDHTDYFSSDTASSTSGSWPQDRVDAKRTADPGHAACTSRSAASTRACSEAARTRSQRLQLQPGCQPRRLHAAGPVSVQEVAVVHGQHDRGLARHVLHSRSLSAERPRRSVTDDPLEPSVLHAAGADHRAGLQPDLGHAEQRVRREVQAHRRAVPQHHPHVRDRQLQPDHPDRRDGHHRRRQHAVLLRGEQPVLRQAARRSRAAEPGARDSRRVDVADVLHELAGVAIRPAIFIGEQRRRRPATSRRFCSSFRGMPSNDLNATASVEVDSRYLAVRQISAGGTYNWTGRVQTTPAGASRATSRSSRGSTIRRTLTQAVNAQANVHTQGQLARQHLLVQLRRDAGQDAQAADIGVLQLAVLRHRVRLSDGSTTAASPPAFLSRPTTGSSCRSRLAGLGNFSPFNGAMSGVPR